MQSPVLSDCFIKEYLVSINNLTLVNYSNLLLLAKTCVSMSLILFNVINIVQIKVVIPYDIKDIL